MPNWRQNHLTIEGEREQLARLRDAVQTTNDRGEVVAFSIARVVLEPPAGDPRRVPSDTHEGGWDWYSWRVENWGSKWDVTDARLAEDGERLVYTFDSAWAPPREGIRRISIAFPTLRFTFAWFEFGMQFYGQDELTDGEMTEILGAEFDSDAYVYPDDDSAPELIDPDLREFVHTHGFGLYA